MYASQFYQIYRFAKITAIHVRAEVVNTSSTTPLTATMACMPLVRANATTDPRSASDIPNAITKQCGLSTGMSRVVLDKTFISQRELGQSILCGQEYYQTYSEALSAATLDDFPCIYVGVISSNGVSWTGIIRYVVTYHIEFSEYDDVAPAATINSQPALKGVVPGRLMREEVEPEDGSNSWVEPTPSLRARMIKVKDNRNRPY